MRVALAIGLCIMLASACTSLPPRPAGPEAAFIGNCREMEPTRDWKPSDPPSAYQRSLFAPPAHAPPGQWFSARGGGIALCTACEAGSSAVQSFEWYTNNFTEGELHIKPCTVSKGKK